MVDDDADPPAHDLRMERHRLQALLVRALPQRANGRAASVPRTLEALCRVAVDEVSVAGAAISLMTVSSAGAVSGAVIAASDERARGVEEMEFDAGQGPGTDAFLGSRPVLTPDLARVSSRWPAYAEAALTAGTCASFALPLHVGAVRLGVLHLHSPGPRTLTDREVATCLTLAEMATEVVLTASDPMSGVEVPGALLGDPGSRDVIYQAQGMVSIDLKITLADALARMRAHAFSTGQDLATLATELVTGRTHLDGP